MSNEGTSQDDRLTPELDSGYVDVDEMRLEDLLAMSSDYAQLLRFFNLKNEPHGDWLPFFASDEAVIFSVILSSDLKKIASDFSSFMKELAWGMGSGMARNLYLYEVDDWRRIPNYALAKKIDHWFTQLQQSSSDVGRNLNQKIWIEIESKLREELQGLKLFLEQYGDGVSALFEADFHRDWFNTRSNFSVPAPSEKKEVITRFLKSNFYAFFNTLIALQDAARRALPLSLKSKRHHASIGLYIAFAHLYQRAQKKLNRFPQRHLDFYYTDLLKVRPRERVADSTYLVFRANKAGHSVWIPAKTAFVAGTDALTQDVIYSSENDLLVNDTQVMSLKTLYFARNPLSSPENSMDFASAAKINTLPIFEASVEDEAQQSWPVFGAPQTEAGQRHFEDAAFGFVLASPVLALKEGNREITLSIKMTYPEGEAFSQENFGRNLDEVLDGVLTKMMTGSEGGAPPSRGEKQAFFFKVFRQMFEVSLSTENGWLTVDHYLPISHIVDATVAEDVLQLRIQLSPDQDAITPYDPALHGKGYETHFPLMRLMINPTSYLFPYSLLMRFIVKEIQIDVVVKEARNLLVHNHLGQLDPNGPFNPFGPIPTVGSYFIVSNPELARKQITDFEIDIEWGDLPIAAGGFETHYKAYPQVFENTSFKASLTTLRGGRWQPLAEDEQEQLSLFSSKRCDAGEDSGEMLDKNRRLSCVSAVNFFRPITGKMSETDFVYSPEIKDGFFKFTLSAPDLAFAHKTYAMLLTRVLTLNARLKHEKLFKPIPNAPYTPLINAISINYKARELFAAAETRGWNDTAKKAKRISITLAAMDESDTVLPLHASEALYYTKITGRNQS